MSSHQTQTQELDRARTDSQGVQRDLLQIRSAIQDLKENVRILDGKVPAHKTRSDRPDRRRSERRQELSRSPSSSSVEDVRSRISLADISSEDTSYSFSADLEVSRGFKEKSSTSKEEKSRSNLSDHDLSDHDLDDLSDSAPELNFSDL